MAAFRSLTDAQVDADAAVAECVGGHLEVSGPVTVAELVADELLAGGPLRGAPLTEARARTGLARLEAEGSAIELPDGRWCARHLLVRLHAASRSRRRRYVEPSSISDFVRFLACWQHVADGYRLEGRAGLRSLVQQLQGLEIAAGEWEHHVLPARVAGYDPRWLDELCLAGEVAWGRLTPRPEPDLTEADPDGAAEQTSSDGIAGNGAMGHTDRPDLPQSLRRGSMTPSPATPLALVAREDLARTLAAVRADQEVLEPQAGASADVLAALRAQGACFRAELPVATGRFPDEVDEGLWDLVARGIVTADAFSAVRSLLAARRTPRPRSGRRRPTRRAALGRQRTTVGSGTGEGRWSLLPRPDATSAGPHSAPASEELAEAVAWQLLDRWGVVFWELWGHESYRVPWREVVRALRRLEARGQALGGRFVAGVSGEQYATPEAAALLSEVRGHPDRGAEVVVAGSDPLNLTGDLLGSPRVPARLHQTVRYRHGVPTELAPTA